MTTSSSSSSLYSVSGFPYEVAGDLPLPPFYHPSQCEDWGYYPDAESFIKLAVEWAGDHHIKPARTMRKRLVVFDVDAQNDFNNPRGTMFVGGHSGRAAIDDLRRAVEWDYKNMRWIYKRYASGDAHLFFQIFFSMFWVDRSGAPLYAHLNIDTNERHQLYAFDDLNNVVAEDIRPNPAMTPWVSLGDQEWALQQAKHYCDALKRSQGSDRPRYRLRLWPLHCLKGGPGSNLSGVMQASILFHSAVRIMQDTRFWKGDREWSEAYSALGEEVLTRWDSNQLLITPDETIKNEILSADFIVLRGQAGSHCSGSTALDFLDKVLRDFPHYAGKTFYLMTDCMSPIVVKDATGKILADFTPQQDAIFQKCEGAGMHLVTTEMPIQTWPDIELD